MVLSAMIADFTSIVSSPPLTADVLSLVSCTTPRAVFEHAAMPMMRVRAAANRVSLPIMMVTLCQRVRTTKCRSDPSAGCRPGGAWAMEKSQAESSAVLPATEALVREE